MPSGFRDAFQMDSKNVGYDDLLLSGGPDPKAPAPNPNLQTSVDKTQPGANVPITQTDSNTEYLRRLAAKGYGTPAPNTDNAAYLDRLKTLGFGSGAHTPNVNDTSSAPKQPSEFTKSLDDLMFDMTKQVFVYPEDLGSNPELLNWVQIEMYETGGYGIESQQKNSVYGITLPQNIGKYSAEQIRNGLNSPAGVVGVNLIGFATVGGDLTQVVTSGMAAKLGKGLWNNFSYEPQFGTQTFGFAQETTGFTTANKKVNKTICLYMPSSLKTSYGVEYNEEDFTALVDVVGKVKVAATTVSNLIKGLPQNESTASLLRGVSDVAARQALAAGNKQLSSLATPLSGGDDLKLDKAYESLTRQVVNPFIINMYKSTKRRSFDFTFRFLPRSREELLAVYNIITTLKKYALPKRAADKAGRILEYPAEFKIKFYHNGIENQFLPKIARCALKDVSLTYGDEPFTTFAPLGKFGAAPTKIDMGLSFEELEILTQDRVDQGY